MGVARSGGSSLNDGTAWIKRILRLTPRALHLARVRGRVCCGSCCGVCCRAATDVLKLSNMHEDLFNKLHGADQVSSALRTRVSRHPVLMVSGYSLWAGASAIHASRLAHTVCLIMAYCRTPSKHNMSQRPALLLTLLRHSMSCSPCRWLWTSSSRALSYSQRTRRSWRTCSPALPLARSGRTINRTSLAA
jgi:bacterioferritin-associated ferredoxin